MSELEPLKSDTTEVVETLKSDIAALRLRLRDAELDDSLPSQRAKFEAAVAALLQPAAVVVREAGPGDTEGVVRCLEAFHTEHAAEVEEGGGTGEAFDRADYARWLPCGSNEAEDALSFTFVAAGPAAGEVRGVLLLCADSTLHELPAVGQHWDISELYVSPQARGEGLGGGCSTTRRPGARTTGASRSSRPRAPAPTSAPAASTSPTASKWPRGRSRSATARCGATARTPCTCSTSRRSKRRSTRRGKSLSRAVRTQARF